MSDDSNRQAGDLEVTPAMIEAGMTEYWEHDIEAEGSMAVLTDVYLAMELARLAAA